MNALQRTTNEGNSQKYIGITAIGTEAVTTDIRHSEYSWKIKDRVVNSTATINNLEVLQPCHTTEPLESEHENNWNGAYREVRELMISKPANVINLQVVYNLKTCEPGKNSRKALMWLHGDMELMKDDIRKNSATAQ